MLYPSRTPTLALALGHGTESGARRLQPPAGCIPRPFAIVLWLIPLRSTKKSPASLRKVGETPNLEGPESARYDRDLDVWFVSNINGSPSTKDNNGYISRLRPDGSPYNLKFIEGGARRASR